MPRSTVVWRYLHGTPSKVFLLQGERNAWVSDQWKSFCHQRHATPLYEYNRKRKREVKHWNRGRPHNIGDVDRFHNLQSNPFEHIIGKQHDLTWENSTLPPLLVSWRTLISHRRNLAQYRGLPWCAVCIRPLYSSRPLQLVQQTTWMAFRHATHI